MGASVPDWVWFSEVRSPTLMSAVDRLATQLTSPTPRTPLCDIMTKFGSDKGGWHNYTVFYSAFFEDRRPRVQRVFEVGLGTNNPNLRSTMGVEGRPGASLRGWREFFPNAQIFGADVDRDILFSDERITTFYVDQLDTASIQAMWRNVDLGEFELIVDDGLHEYEENTNFLYNSIDRLSQDGIYVIEDLYTTPVKQYAMIKFLTAIDRPAALLNIPISTEAKDNCLAVICGS